MSSKAAKKSNVNSTARGSSSRQASGTGSAGRWLMIFPALILGYVPVVMRTYQYDPGMSQFEWFDDGQVVDVYLASKMFVLLTIGFIMLCAFLLYKMIEAEKLKFEKVMIPLCVYFVMVVLSGIFSPYKTLAWGGAFEMFESVPVVMMYVFTAFFVFWTMRDRDDFNFFWRLASPGILIECLIASFQSFGMDFLATNFGKHLYLSPAYWSQIDTMTTGMGDVSYGTMYNPDFLPAYYAVIIPLAAAAFFMVQPPRDEVTLALLGKSERYESRRYLLERVYDAVILGFAILSIYGSARTTGRFVIMVVLAILFTGDMIRERKHVIFLIAAGILAVAAFLAVSFSDTSIGETIRSRMGLDPSYSDNVYVENLYNKEDEVEFVVSYYGKTSVYHAALAGVDEVTNVNPDTGEETVTKVPRVSLTCDDMDGITITPSDDSSTTVAATRADDESFSISVTGYCYDDQYDEYGQLTTAAYRGITIYAPSHNWRFDLTDEGYKFRNFRQMDVDFPSELEYSRVFYDGFFHGRGYLYNYTIPLLKNYILLGAGSNTYVRVYPQNDYLYETFHSLDVKPHCFYLQQWTDNGLIALIAIVVFLVWVTFELLGLLTMQTEDEQWKKGGPFRYLTIACLSGVLGVAVSWLANDSNICTSPTVWTVFGLALVCIGKGREAGKKGGNA